MFTLEIAGKSVAVINGDEEDARDLVEDDAFQDDLRSLQSKGQTLWNGTDELVIRPATEGEIETGQAALDQDDEDDDEEGGISIVFVVPLDGDLEDDDDE
jgi:hypothetical protein